MWGGDHLDRRPDAPHLHIAAHDGDVDWLAAHLDAHPQKVDHPDGQGWTPLHWASARGHDGLVTVLLARGAQVDRRNRWGCTALFLACSEGHRTTASLLIGAGADPTATTTAEQVTPLMEAAWQGRLECVLLLVRRERRNVDETDVYGRTALWKAIYFNHYRVAQVLLIEGKANPFVAALDGRMPAEIAGERGNRACQRLLEEAERVYLIVKVRVISEASGQGRRRDHVVPQLLVGRLEDGQPMPQVRWCEQEAMEEDTVPMNFPWDEGERAPMGEPENGRGLGRQDVTAVVRLGGASEPQTPPSLGYIVDTASTDVFLEFLELMGPTTGIPDPDVLLRRSPSQQSVQHNQI